jgi:hypothetical protein
MNIDLRKKDFDHSVKMWCKLWAGVSCLENREPVLFEILIRDYLSKENTSVDSMDKWAWVFSTENKAKIRERLSISNANESTLISKLVAKSVLDKKYSFYVMKPHLIPTNELKFFFDVF